MFYADYNFTHCSFHSIILDYDYTYCIENRYRNAHVKFDYIRCYEVPSGRYSKEI